MGRKGKKRTSRKLLMQRRLTQRLTLSRTPVITVKPRGMGSNVFSLISKMTRASSATGRVLAGGRYTHRHRILLLGEGNFSFAVCLASALGGDHIVATSFDCRSELFDKYPEARENVRALENMGAHVLHGIDATRLDEQRDKLLARREMNGCFDRVVFNFPHVGGGSVKEDLIANQQMLTIFFACAGKLLSVTGEIHVTLRATSFYDSWDINTLAENTRLRSLGAVQFDHNAFYGYQQVRTRGSTCMREAPTTAGAKTYRFASTATQMQKRQTKTAAMVATTAPQDKVTEIASASLAQSQRDDQGPVVSSDSSSEHSDDDDNSSASNGRLPAATAEMQRTGLTAAAEKKRKLLLELRAEREDSDADSDVPVATKSAPGDEKLAAAQKRKRRLLQELRNERELSHDDKELSHRESTRRKRPRAHTVKEYRNRLTNTETNPRISPNTKADKPHDPIAAMLSQWKQVTTYT